MASPWDSLEIVSRISTIAQSTVLLAGVVALIASLRASTLQTRLDAARRAASDSAVALARLDLDRLYDYSETGTWNYRGSKSISKDYSLPGPISGWSDGYVKDDPSGKKVRYDDEAVAHYKETSRLHPKYPFPEYFLAEALRLRGDSGWRAQAKRAIEAFQKTTAVPVHSPDHDEALSNLRRMVGTAGNEH